MIIFIHPFDITAALTEHSMMKAYLYRFHLREDATCSCGNGYQWTIFYYTVIIPEILWYDI